jgi:hypothetical protein
MRSVDSNRRFAKLDGHHGWGTGIYNHRLCDREQIMASDDFENSAIDYSRIIGV